MGAGKKGFAGGNNRLKRPGNLWQGGQRSAGGSRGGKSREEASGGGDAGTRKEGGDRGAKSFGGFGRRRKNEGDSGGNWSGRGASGGGSSRGQGRQGGSNWKSDKKSSGDKAPWLAKGGGEDRERGEGKAGRGKKTMQAGTDKKTKRQRQTRGAFGGGGQRTGANEIEVNWKPPGAAEEEEAAARDQPHGVTPKSGPPRKPSPSPVRGPAGRGRPEPAWKKKVEGAQLALPSIPSDVADKPASDRGESPVRGPAGRGRSEVKPAWMTRQEGNKDVPPSIPDEGENEDRGRRSSRASRSRSGQHRKPWGGGGGNKGGRDDSGWWDKNDWNSGNDWRDYRGRHGGRNSWKDDRHDWRRGGNWHQDDDRGSWSNHKQRGNTYSSSSTSKAYADGDGKEQEWDDKLLCAVHQRRRTWDQLVGNSEGEWVCRRGCPCVVYVGGPKATLDLAAALEDWKKRVNDIRGKVVEDSQRRVFERGESTGKERRDEAEAKDLPKEGKEALRIEDGSTASKHDAASAPRDPEKEESPPRRKVFVEEKEAKALSKDGIDQDDL